MNSSDTKCRKTLNASTLEKGQNIVAAGSLLTVAYAAIGEKTELLKPETAKKILRGGLAGLCISAAPTVYKKVDENNLLDKLSNVFLKNSTNLLIAGDY